MEPKQKRLTEAEAVLLKAEDNLADKQRSLDDVQARLVANSVVRSNQHELRKAVETSRRNARMQGVIFVIGTCWHCLFRVQSLTDQHDACQERVKDLENQMQITEQRLSRAAKVLSGVSVEGARWAVDARALQDDMSNLLSDVLLAAGTLSNAGQRLPAFVPFSRHLYLASATCEAILCVLKEHAPVSEFQVTLKKQNC